MSDSRALVVEVVVAAPADTVWNALRDPAAITRWFGWNHPGLPEEIEYIFATHATADDATHRLTIDVYELTLHARGDETVVRVTRGAPAGGSWDEIYDEIVEGWRTFIQQLRFTLNHHPGEPRRTVYLSGRARAEGGRPPEALGLGPLSETGPDDPYALGTAVGDRLSGRVWFRSAWQIGLVVDTFGPGLLVAMRRPPTDKSPHGGGMFVLSLYGFDEAAHAAIAARWKAWFDASFDAVTLQT